MNATTSASQSVLSPCYLRLPESNIEGCPTILPAICVRQMFPHAVWDAMAKAPSATAQTTGPERAAAMSTAGITYLDPVDQHVLTDDEVRQRYDPLQARSLWCFRVLV